MCSVNVMEMKVIMGKKKEKEEVGGKEEEELRGRGRDRDKRIEMHEILFNCQIVEVTI